MKLRKKDTGQIFPYSEILAKRSDMEEVKEEAELIKEKEEKIKATELKREPSSDEIVEAKKVLDETEEQPPFYKRLFKFFRKGGI